uniref:Uncharacterized protein n=1 Tax=Panagrolaimus sp. ES5 TaxID=591445 RepID=A0AC34FQ63_9BILA
MFMVLILTSNIVIIIFMGFSTIFTSFVQCFKKKPNSSKKNKGQPSSQQSNDGSNNVTDIGSGGIIIGSAADGSSTGRNNGGGGNGNDGGNEKSKRQPSLRTKTAVTPLKKPNGVGGSSNGKSSGKKNSGEEIGGGGGGSDHDSGPGGEKKENLSKEEKVAKGLIVRRQADYPAMDDVISDWSDESENGKKKSAKKSVKQSIQQSQKNAGKKKKQKGAATGEKTLTIDPTQKNNDKLPEVETTVDGKFIITYPNIDGQPQQQQKQEQKNETSSSSPSKDETNHHPSLTQNPQTSITNLKDEKKPIMPNIGPLTAYGHPSTRYKSVDRDIETSSAASKESDGTETLTEKSNNDSESDSEPDPFVSQRKIRPVVVPDAYAAAPIVFKSRGDPFVFSTIQTTQTSAEKTTVIENVETFPTLISVQEPLETSILPTTTSSTTAPTTTIAPIHAVTAVKIQDISPIIVPLSSFSTSETTTLSSSTTTPTTTSPRIPIQDTAPSASSTVPLP